mgnify:CR=1 FL=1
MICNLCPRNCGALRTESAGEGYCRMPEVPVLARAALHQWEEPPISGTRGSGTVFFSGCNLRCCFCQNGSISHGGVGKPITAQRLREIFRELIAPARDYILNTDFTFLFFHFDSVDGAGHRYGYGTGEHLAAIEANDGYIGALVDALRDAGYTVELVSYAG